MKSDVENLTSIDNEMAVCGALILDRTSVDKVRGVVSELDFSDPLLGRLFSLLVEMIDAGHEVRDITLLASRLKASRLFDGLGGVRGLRKLVDACGAAKSVGSYGKSVAKLASQRRLVTIALKMHADAQAVDADPNAIATWAQGQVQSTIRSDEGEFQSFYDACLQSIKRIQDVQARGGSRADCIPTGFDSLDAKIGGLFRGDLNIIAARPSVGKSALATQLAVNASLLGYRTMFVSLEMKPWSITDRVIAANIGVENRDVRSALLNIADMDRFIAESKRWEGLPFYFWHPKRGATASQIAANIRVRAALHGLDMVVVDYFQLVKRESRYGSEKLDQYEAILSEIRSIGVELNLVNVLVAQLNRGSENEKPKISDIKGAGKAEEDADGIWLLQRERDSDDTKLMVAKQRNGAVCDVHLRFNRGATRYEEISQYE